MKKYVDFDGVIFDSLSLLFDEEYEPVIKNDIYVKEVVDEAEDYYLEFVTDEALIEKLREL